MEDLQGKVALITGGASGIGRAVAEKAADEGMKIVIADIEEGPLKEAEGELTGRGAEAMGVVTDVSDAASVRELRDRALERFGAVHLVHNNAGIGTGGPIWDFSEEDWRWIIGVNQWGVIHGIATFVPLLMEQGEGHVVNTASIAGLTTTAFWARTTRPSSPSWPCPRCSTRTYRRRGRPWACRCSAPASSRPASRSRDRNRPAWAPERTVEGAEELRAVIQSMVDGGIPPAAVADRVIDAVKTNTFYILTHPELTEAIQIRCDDMVQGRPPTATNIA